MWRKLGFLSFFISVSFYILIINVIDLRKKITTTCILVFLCKILIEIRDVMNVMYVIIMIGITILRLNMQIVMNICKCFPLTLQIIFIYTGRHPAKMTIGCKIMHLLRYAKMHTEDLIKSDMFYDNVTTISQLISYCVDAYIQKNVRCYVFITK